VGWIHDVKERGSNIGFLTFGIKDYFLFFLSFYLLR
jgi:hypothetical protein